MEHSHSSQQKQDSLSSEVDTLKQSCWDLERAMTDLQNMLEAKNASLASSNSDLQVAEEQYQRLMAKVEEMQGSILRAFWGEGFVRGTAAYTGQSLQAPLLGPRKICPPGPILGSLVADDLAPYMPV